MGTAPNEGGDHFTRGEAAEVGIIDGHVVIR
jgi:hypothetical protein